MLSDALGDNLLNFEVATRVIAHLHVFVGWVGKYITHYVVNLLIRIGFIENPLQSIALNV